MTLQGAIQQLHDMRSDDNFPIYYKPAIDKVIETIITDAQEVRRGRWVDLKCDQCGQVDMSKPNFCPNCGADMREKKNECDDCFIPMFYNLEDDDSICRDCEVGE